MRQSGEPVAVDAFVIFEIARRDAQDIVVFAGHKVADEHVRAAFHRRFELRQRLGELAGQRDMHDGDHLIVERLVRQPGMISADNTIFLQNVEPARAGGG